MSWIKLTPVNPHFGISELGGPPPEIIVDLLTPINIHKDWVVSWVNGPTEFAGHHFVVVQYFRANVLQTFTMVGTPDDFASKIMGISALDFTSGV
jgi:hypothetical protein